MNLTKFINSLSLIIILSCNDSAILPKQNAFLRIEFEEPNYKIYNPMIFQIFIIIQIL